MPDQTEAPLPSYPHALTWWYGFAAVGGVTFGWIGERRPFGQGFFGHPLLVFFIIVGLALLALRFALMRPVSEIISDRALVFGCLIGAASFLIGNWFAAHLTAMP